MSLLPYFAITFGAGATALLLATRRTMSPAIGLLGLAAATVAAVTVRPGDPFPVGAEALVASDYGRLILILGSATVLLLCLAGAASAWGRTVPGGALIALGTAGLAVTIPDPAPAVGAAVASGLAGVLLTTGGPATARRVDVAIGEFRVVAIAGAVAIVATAWPGHAAEGAVWLALGAALAARFGGIPFHLWAARLPDTAPEIALPLVMAWIPAVFAVVILGAGGPFLGPVEAERAALVAIAAATILLGGLAAWVQDDLGHLVGYTIVQDAGFVVLGFAAADPAAAASARAWLLVFAVAKTGLAAALAGVRGAFGTRRLDELSGWARRAPALALAFGLVALATIGLPGLMAWEVRFALVDRAIGGPIGAVVLVGGFASLLAYGRVISVGLGTPGKTVAEGAGERPRRPARATREPAPGPAPVWMRVRGAVVARARELGAGWQLNRPPVAAALALALAILSVAVSAGGFGLREAASAAGATAPTPAASAPTGTQPSASPAGGIDLSPAPVGTLEPSFAPLPSP